MPKRQYKDPFHVSRRKAWARAKAQANFRDEVWELTFEDWCAFWPTPEIWAERGRGSDKQRLMRYDDEDIWTRSNCCRIPGKDMMCIRNRRTRGLPIDHLWSRAIFLE